MSFDEIRDMIEAKLKGEKVQSIVDLNDKYFVVALYSPGMIPGRFYKINKKTGSVDIFNPIDDFDEYFEAVEKRSKIFIEPGE